MAVLVIAEVEGQTRQGYEGMLSVLEPILRQSTGFIAHGGGLRVGGGWMTFEIWESQADATAFFAKHVHPNLPPDVKPKRALVELHALVTATGTVAP
jgi:hypothetical protein